MCIYIDRMIPVSVCVCIWVCGCNAIAFLTLAQNLQKKKSVQLKMGVKAQSQFACLKQNISKFAWKNKNPSK